MRVNYQKVGERIKALREQRKMSLGDLEKKTNFTQKSILLAEMGQAALNLDFLVQICDALDVTPNDLLAGEYKATQDTPSQVAAKLDALIEASNGENSGSRTKIKDTDTVISEFKQVVADTKRENKDKKKTTQNTFKYF